MTRQEQGCLADEDAVKNNFSKEEAIKKAEILFVEKYGKQVLKQHPFEIESNEANWVVKGTLHCPQGMGKCLGGVAEVSFSKKSGKVNYIIHGK